MKDIKKLSWGVPIKNKGTLFSDFSISPNWELWFDPAAPKQKYTVKHFFSICFAEGNGVTSLRIILLWAQWIIEFVPQSVRTEH
jgi:hypothetical protein